MSHRVVFILSYYYSLDVSLKECVPNEKEHYSKLKQGVSISEFLAAFVAVDCCFRLNSTDFLRLFPLDEFITI